MEHTQKKRAFITGVGGQDGSYLSELLLNKGYEVHGLIYQGGENIDERIIQHKGSLTDAKALFSIVDSIRPQEVYNLGAQSSVSQSFKDPVATVDVTGLGAVRLLEAVRSVDTSIRYYQAGSSEMFGVPDAPPPFSETTPFRPRSPYAYAKVLAHQATVQYRESYDMFACNGILFNHESERRPDVFVTKKIVRAAVNIAAGTQQELLLGNMDVRRDWGYAPEYVEAMYLMMQADEPQDFVIGTGVSHSVRDFVAAAFTSASVVDWESRVHVSPEFYRPAEIDDIFSDPSKADRVLGWRAQTTFAQLVDAMVQHEKSLPQTQ